MNHRCMSTAQKAAITDTFQQPYSVRVQPQTKAEDSSLILSTQKAKEVEKQNWISHQILLRRSSLCTEQICLLGWGRHSRVSAEISPQPQWAQSLRFVPGYKHWRRLMQPFIQGKPRIRLIWTALHLQTFTQTPHMDVSSLGWIFYSGFERSNEAW